MINVYMCRDTMKQSMNVCSRVETLGRQLGLDTEQIHAIMNTNQQEPEHLSFSLGPPMYSGGYYGTISISDFNVAKGP
jgi:hypothetical protein